MKFDSILEEIGEFGSYQRIKYFLLCLPPILSGMHGMIPVFLTAIPDHRCNIPGYADDTYATQGYNHTQAILSNIPSAYNNDTCKTEYIKCTTFNGSVNGGPTDEHECSEWVFDKSIYESTVMTEFHLVCGKETYRIFAQTIFMVGLLLGSIIFGSLSDWLGRKKVLLLCIFLCTISSIAVAFAPDIISFIILRMFVGATLMGGYMTAFVMGIELVGPSKRMWTGNLINITWAVGVVGICGVAYFIRDWTTLQLVISAPMAIFLCYWWGAYWSAIRCPPIAPQVHDDWDGWLAADPGVADRMMSLREIQRLASRAGGALMFQWGRATIAAEIEPHSVVPTICFTESPRWLMAKGRYKEAQAILEDVARGNKTVMPKIDLEDTEKSEQNGEIEQVKPWQMFSSCVLLVRCLIIFWNWIVVTMVYYGLSLNSGNLAGNTYLNLFLSGLIEFPAYILCLFLWDRIGRKPVQVGSMVIGGLACIATVGPVLVGSADPCEDSGLETATMVLSLIGKFGASVAFATIYIYSAELFPTVVRNASMGMSSMMARFGGMLSPVIADLAMFVSGNEGKMLPLLVFGVCSVTAGIAALWLPETLNHKLPDTIEEAKDFGRKQKNKFRIVSVTTNKEEEAKANTFAYLNPAFKETDTKSQ